ncbi:MAG: radical SAM protein [Candidatus Heimdallarchaeota archaeon]
MTIEKIRVSIGSASVLNLIEIKDFKDLPSTCYLMTYVGGRCTANCGFCPQARDSISSTERLSRVTWPVFDFKEFLTKLNYMPPPRRFKRICIQTLRYNKNFQDLVEIVTQIKKNSNIPLSIAIPPMSKEKLNDLKVLGVERVGIALDASTPKLFDEIKGKHIGGPYNWETHIQNLKDALDIFSEGQVTTHLIVGLGERPKEIIELISELDRLKIRVSLFAFTPIKGTRLESKPKPQVLNFRKIQLARFLILNKKRGINDFTFNMKDDIVKFNLNKIDLWNIVDETNAFMTSGCPGCNRPYYTSSPSGPIYNYPRNLNQDEKDTIYQSLLEFVH